jgi:hypothetical protein
MLVLPSIHARSGKMPSRTPSAPASGVNSRPKRQLTEKAASMHLYTLALFDYLTAISSATSVRPQRAKEKILADSVKLTECISRHSSPLEPPLPPGAGH